MIKTIEVKKGMYLHIHSKYGWYIDSEKKYKSSMLSNIPIERKSNKSSFFNHPNIYVMSGCNGKCKYCYQEEHLNQGFNNLSITEIKKFLDFLEERQDKTQPKIMELFGGEPLLRKDILDIIALIKQRGYHINIATNGTLPILRQKEFIDLCKERVHIRISLDGHTSELHELYRTKGSFGKIVENIHGLVSNHIDTSVKSIIVDNNFPYLYDILCFVRDCLGIKKWNYNVLYQLRTCQKNNVVSSVTHDMMIKEMCKKKYFEFMPMLMQTPFAQMITSVFIKQTKKYRRTYPFLNYDGKIYINDQLIVPEFELGTIDTFREDYWEIIKKIELQRKSCEMCYAEDYCYLGNYGELYMTDRTLISEFPTCDIMRKCVVYLMSQGEYGVEMLKNIYVG
ncbi:radical SAM protein [[Clostridium] polysaccharolyticum]|uniref:Radical SAM superfamily enzyme, MoaA/NifB/PqqE/SkfB family n=1 Tax=[Clostridium] polysaccharolyticum TaxID=29364 RepID=A0A1I0EJZ3_9FIRM|nr:radical SAM protein [[Clostridium] polysaccharolyticum]SET45490.1 Radical SAM superfamily enzyme, MoaA/NifB/PqqE/SkfB family [[Clostridium] polysaccharolyticum]